MRALVHGFPYSNEMLPYAMDYFKRGRLVKLGFLSQITDLDAFSADMYLTIDTAYATVQEEKLKKG